MDTFTNSFNNCKEQVKKLNLETEFQIEMMEACIISESIHMIDLESSVIEQRLDDINSQLAEINKSVHDIGD